MKKILALVLCLIMLTLSSCQTAKKPEQTAESGESQAVESVTASDPEEAIYARLARLTKEDGTGEISLDMGAQEIVEVLNKYGIEYNDFRPDDDEQGGFVGVADNRYFSNNIDGWGTFALMQSYKGLKYGDTVEKVLELYGKPDEIMETSQYETYVYVYPQRTVDAGGYTVEISFDVLINEDIVKGMYIQRD
ncbi:MAG: hypothetical protein IJL87_04045 [Clostridia bacterium]|nr:hypothetical protein [Clostridia bacterium]